MANWTTSNFSNLIIETNLNEIFIQGLAKEDMIHERLYNVKKTKTWEDKDLTIGNLPLYAPNDEGADIHVVAHSQKYLTTYEQARYDAGFITTWELGRYDMYNVIEKLGGKLLDSAKATMEYYGADLFNNQTSTAAGYVLTDTKALVASDHPLAGGGSTSNNAGAVDLGVATLETACYHYEVLKDDHSNPRAAKTPKLLMVHPSDRFLLSKILKSVNVPFEISNTYNALKDYNLVPVVWKWLSDTDAWGLFPDNIEYNKCFKSYDADIEVTYEGRTRNKLVTSVMVFDFGFSDWRDVYMGQGG